MLCIWVKWKYLGNFLDYSIKITIYLVRPLKLFNIFEKLETFQQGNIFLKLHRSKETGILNYLTSNWLISINCPIFYPNSKLYLLFSVVKFSSLILQRGKTPTYRKENYENFFNFSAYDKLCPNKLSCRISISHHLCSTLVRHLRFTARDGQVRLFSFHSFIVW